MARDQSSILPGRVDLSSLPLESPGDIAILSLISYRYATLASSMATHRDAGPIREGIPAIRDVAAGHDFWRPKFNVDTPAAGSDAFASEVELGPPDHSAGYNLWYAVGGDSHEDGRPYPLLSLAIRPRHTQYNE